MMSRLRFSFVVVRDDSSSLPEKRSPLVRSSLRPTKVTALRT